MATTTTKLSKAQLKTLLTITARGGEMNGYAGQPGFYCNSVNPLVRQGFLERVADCPSCEVVWREGWSPEQKPCERPLVDHKGKSSPCYCRVRITDAGRDEARRADPTAYAQALPAEQVQAELDRVASKSYVVHFARIGRDHQVAPLLTGPVDGPNHLAELIYRHARPHLASRDVEVAVDATAGKGSILANFRTGGTFTLHRPDEPVPFVHPELGAMPGYVAGWCGHRVAGSEWRAGFRVCEHCPDPRALAEYA